MESLQVWKTDALQSGKRPDVQGGGEGGIKLSCDSTPADDVAQNPYALGKWGVGDKREKPALTGSQRELPDGSSRVVLGDQYTENLCNYVTVAGGKKEVDLDSSILLFNAKDELLEVVSWSNLNSSDGSIVHQGDNLGGGGGGDDEKIDLDLDRIRKE